METNLSSVYWCHLNSSPAVYMLEGKVNPGLYDADVIGRGEGVEGRSCCSIYSPLPDTEPLLGLQS